MALNIPRHTLTDPMDLVLEHDDAWDKDRLEKELGDMKERGEDTSSHPYIQYQMGETRFNLSLVMEYLDMKKNPLVFRLRKLPRSRYYALLDNQEKAGFFMGYQEWCRYGIESIVGMSLDADVAKGEMLSERDMDNLERKIGRNLIPQVGVSVSLANSDLKKK